MTAELKNGTATIERPAKKDKKQEKVERLVVTPPNFRVVQCTFVGLTPYVQNAFSHKAFTQIHEAQAAGKKSKTKKVHEAKDFQACYEGALHRFTDGGYGIPAPAFRNAMIDACRAANLKMTVCKQAIFIQADGIGTDGTPLVRILKGEPEYFEAPVRLESGVIDLRARPMFKEWRGNLRIEFDADMVSPEHLVNLLLRAGKQVGVGEGRPFSKKSNGQGWGTFTVEGFDEEGEE